jgi:hypothetical protein
MTFSYGFLTRYKHVAEKLYIQVLMKRLRFLYGISHPTHQLYEPRPEASMAYLVQNYLVSRTSLIAYSEAKRKINGCKASYCFRPFLVKKFMKQIFTFMDFTTGSIYSHFI